MVSLLIAVCMTAVLLAACSSTDTTVPPPVRTADVPHGVVQAGQGGQGGQGGQSQGGSVQRKAYLLAYTTCQQYSPAETAKSYGWKTKKDIDIADKFAKYNFNPDAEGAASLGCLQAFRGYPKDPP